MGEKGLYHLDPSARTAVRAWLASQVRDRGFGNGRLARNLFESAVANQASRLVEVDAPTDDQLTTLTASDIPPLPPLPDAPGSGGVYLAEASVSDLLGTGDPGGGDGHEGAATLSDVPGTGDSGNSGADGGQVLGDRGDAEGSDVPVSGAAPAGQSDRRSGAASEAGHEGAGGGASA
jgi:hypothetical protein